jgi:hypothetical protein
MISGSLADIFMPHALPYGADAIRVSFRQMDDGERSLMLA